MRRHINIILKQGGTISAAYFGAVVGYLLTRLVIWLPLAFILLMGAKLFHRPLAIGEAAVVALALEVVTTLGSILLSQKMPYGIFFRSFATYLGARILFWVPLASGFLIALERRSSARDRV